MCKAGSVSESAKVGHPFVAARVSAWIGPIHRLTTAATKAPPPKNPFKGMPTESFMPNIFHKKQLK